MHDPALERAIARKFEEIADIGWFPDTVPHDFAQLRALRRLLPPLAGRRVLDAGCARGRFARHIANDGAAVFGIDLTEVFLQAARRNVPGASFSRASLSALPFPDNYFDAAYCIEVLEHLPDTDLALREMARVLKPGGTLIVIDKSLSGLSSRSGLPNWFEKPRAERKGKWMYPPDFPFRERWFWPKKLVTQMRQCLREARIEYIPEGRGKASVFYKLLPFFSMDVAWVGRK